MNLHVIIGEDDYLVSEAAKKVIGTAGHAVEVIDSRNATNEDLQLKDLSAADASFSTPPFLDPIKITWWKNVGFLPAGGGKGPSEATKEALEKFAKKLAANPLPENQKFILSGPKLLQTSIFAKTLKPVAEITVFSSGKPWEQARQAEQRVIGMAHELGLTFAPGAERAFVGRVGPDTRSLANELQKMRDYLGDKTTVTAADVSAIASQGAGVEPFLWEVTNALGVRNFAKVLAAVKPFEGENGFAVFMTTVIEKFFRQMIVDPKPEFLAYWTPRELAAARRIFLNLREKAVSSSESVDTLILIALARVCKK